MEKDHTDDEESDSDYVPTVDARNFTSQKYEARFKWLYFSSVTKGYMCKYMYCELFGIQAVQAVGIPYVTKWIQLGTHPTRKLSVHTASTRHKKGEFSFTTEVETVHNQILRHEETQMEKNQGVI